MASLSEIKGGAATTTPKAKSLAEIKGGVRPSGTKAPQPIPERTTQDKWQDRSVGFAQSLLGTAVGTARMLQTAGQGVMAALHPTKTFSDIHEEYGLKSLKSNTREGQSVTQTLTPKNKEQQQGKLVGDVAQYIMPATKINKATAALPWIQRTALRTAPDVLTSIAQNQGAGLSGDETTKNAGITAITSGVANALIPGSSVSKTSEFLRTLAPGYVADVATGLAGQRGEDREGGKAFIPGMGTFISGTMGTVQAGARTYSDYKTGVTAAKKRTVAFDDLTKKYKRVETAVDAANKKGVDARDILTNTNILNGAVDADGTVSVERALQNFDEFVQPYEGKVREAIRREGTKVRIADVASAMDDFAAKSDLNGAAYEQLNSTLLSDLKGLQRKYGDNIPVEALQDTKIFRGMHNNYLDSGANAVNKEATRFFKEAVENNVRSLDVKEYNGELSKLYSVRDVIESLSRTKVKGARLGKYFASAIGTGIGASSGNPLLAILGAEIGSRTNSAILSRSLGGNITKGMEVPGELTDILARQKTGKDVIPPVEIPRGKPFGELNLQSSSKVGSRNMSQPATMTKTKKAIPNTILPVKDFNNKLSTGEKYRNAKLAAIAELDVELNELSQAGYRYTKPSDVGGGSDFVGVGSTFPKWVPEHLRSKSLFDTVMPMVEKETPPPPHASKQLELYNVLQEELQKRIDNPRKEFRAPKGNSEVFAGAAVGFEEDENGNLTFSPEKALVGMVGVAGLTRSQAVRKLSDNLDTKMRKVMTDFIDVVRTKGVTTRNGRLVFSSDDAEEAFNKGLSFVEGTAGRELQLGDIANSTPGKIANFFQDIVSAGDKAKKGLGTVTPTVKKGAADLSTEMTKYTGKEIEYAHNPKRHFSKEFSAQFAQDIEPAGKYVNFGVSSASKLKGIEYGKVKLKNPLVLEWKTSREGGWKTDLSNMYGGKTGKELSKAIVADGYDAIVTVNKGNPSEVVLLRDDIWKGAAGGEMKLYHGTDKQFASFEKPTKNGIYGRGVYFYTGKQRATNFAGKGGRVVEASIPANAKLATNAMFDDAIAKAREEGYMAGAAHTRATDILSEKGYVGIKDKDIVVIFDPKDLNQTVTSKGAADLSTSIKQAKAAGKTFDEWVKGQATELNYKNLQENDYSIKAYGKDFNEPVEYFRAGQVRKNGDIWLTDNEAGAMQYSSAGGGTKVRKYIVQSRNPLIIDTAGGKYAKGNIDINKILTKEEIAQGYTNNPDTKKKFIDYAKNNGYDAVQFGDSFPDGEGGMRSLVVWNKDALKTRSQLKAEWDAVQ